MLFCATSSHECACAITHSKHKLKRNLETEEGPGVLPDDTHPAGCVIRGTDGNIGGNERTELWSPNECKASK
ncbi:hypothetical protein X798_06490 [Onchocerca flexuosa]|uniref:Uncharacterized protein n=1 Tax=Onchocerca flexuosa TaxID=387005 RepID=A0A238BMQ1_9BILA|nr:hypothetical protein X798_06490 [Onchocerca flexuosa]